MEFIREHTLLHKLIIVDGIGKCGKSLLLDIMTNFSSVEKQEFNEFLEYIALAYKYKKISHDIAIAILKTQMDTELYNNMIGRYINTRWGDATSVYNYHTPEKYIRRSISNDGFAIHKKVLEEKPIYLCWAHDLINKSDIIFEAFDTKLEWFYLNRRPLDIIYEWNRVGYSERMAKDPTEMQYNIKYNNTVVPEVALGWEEEFLNSNSTERTVKMIHTYFKLNQDELIKKNKYKNVHVINFEDLVTNPNVEIERLKKIICNEPLTQLDQILIKGKCPRILKNEEYVEKDNYIKKNISSQYNLLLSEMEEMYQNIKKLAVGV